jgi:hypothetical protein
VRVGVCRGALVCGKRNPISSEMLLPLRIAPSERAFHMQPTMVAAPANSAVLADLLCTPRRIRQSR